MNAQPFLTIEWAFGLLVSFFIALLWHFIKVLEDKFDDAQADRTQLRERLHDVEKQYQSKAEARETRQEITALLHEIKADLNKVNEKLDKKADKS